jgi:hypothetical protein
MIPMMEKAVAKDMDSSLLTLKTSSKNNHQIKLLDKMNIAAIVISRRRHFILFGLFLSKQ